MEASRITIEPGKRSGQPCIRGLRITVWDVLGWLAAGVDEETILADYPELEAADFPRHVRVRRARRAARCAVKLLLDENLSRRLVRRIEDLFSGSAHVGSEGLLQTPDSAVWEYAKNNGFSIVTADADFYELATAFGPPPKVIWLRGCDYPTAVAEELIRGQAIRIAEFLIEPEQAVLILRQT